MNPLEEIVRHCGLIVENLVIPFLPNHPGYEGDARIENRAPSFVDVRLAGELTTSNLLGWVAPPAGIAPTLPLRGNATRFEK